MDWFALRAPRNDGGEVWTGAGEASGEPPTHPVNPFPQKYSTFPNFGFMAYNAHPGPAKGALRDRHEMRAGVRWTRQRRRGKAVTGTDNPLSHARRGYDTAIVTAAWLIVGGAHIGPRRKGQAVRGRNKSCGPDVRSLASSLSVMRRPDRVRTSHKPQRRRGQQCIAPRGEHEGHR